MYRSALLSSVAGMPDELTGTVWIAWLPNERQFTCYWDASPDAAPAMLEQGPDTDDDELVLGWANARAKRVFIRPRFDPDEYYRLEPDGRLTKAPVIDDDA